MDPDQLKIAWQGEVVSIQPRSKVWRYIADNRTHRECGFNVFIKGTVQAPDGSVPAFHPVSEKYDFCVAISELQEYKLEIRIGDELKGSAWTKKYPEIEFADYYRVGSLKKIKAVKENSFPLWEMGIDTVQTGYEDTPILRVHCNKYPGPPWKMTVPPLEVYAWRGERMLSKSCWKGKCFQCVWANMANVNVQYDFDRNIVKNRFETFCYGPLSCKYYKMGPARAVPYKGMSGIKDQGWLDEMCVQNRADEDE